MKPSTKFEQMLNQAKISSKLTQATPHAAIKAMLTLGYCTQYAQLHDRTVL